MILLLLLAQLSHFVRPHFPERRDFMTCQCKVLSPFVGEFTMPRSGTYTLDYTKLYPGNYNGTLPVAAPPAFDDRKKPGHGNQTPIYDVDESYDHITVQAKPGTKWFYTIVIAVPK